MHRLAVIILAAALPACAQGSSTAVEPLEGSGRSGGDAGTARDAAPEADGGTGGFGIAGDASPGADAADDGAVTCVPSPEVCNGLDDDCNLVIDDDDVCPCAVTERAGRAYLFCDDSRPWDAARMRCQSLGYDLAVIDDAMEDAYVFGEIDTRGFADTWIGMNDQTTEDTWQWIDGTPFTYRHWDDGEPNDGGESGEDCGLIMTREGRASEWDDRDCGDPYPFVCETR